MKTPFTLSEEIARKVLTTVDAGLVKGVGKAIPGQMCVEAAVCYAMGLPHGDEPTCVSEALRKFKIGLNDSNWSSDSARAKGMRRLAIAQLGSAGALDDIRFVTLLAAKAGEWAKGAKSAYAARAADAAAYAAATDYATADYAAYATAYAYDAAAGTYAAYAAYAAYAYAYAAYAYAARAAAYDKALSKFAEDVVQILIDMKAPGCAYLYLTENTK
jgi:hypothetical protein